MKFWCIVFVLCFVVSSLAACTKGGKADASSTNESGTGSAVSSTGAEETEPVVLEGVIAGTAEDYEIDNAMMAFFLYDTYNAFVNENYYYLSIYGLDTTKSLKEQTFWGDESQTWFSYFLDSAKNWVNEMIGLAVEAKRNGMTLSDEDRALIEDYVADMQSYAEENEYEDLDAFLCDYYINGVTEAAVRKCVELQILASNYYQFLYDGFVYTDADLAQYVETHPESFYCFDYGYYPIEVEYEEGATDAEKKAAVAQAKAEAEAFMASVTDEASFLAAIEAREEIDEEDPASYVVEGQYYDPEDAFSKWAYSSDRQIGDRTVIEETDAEGNVIGYTVYMLTQTAYKEDYATKHVRHILFTKNVYGSDEAAKAKAEEVLALYQKGEQTEEAFGALAKEYTEDSNGDAGGLYENVPQGYMVPTFNDWMFDESRRVGDVDIVKTDYGYHIMYHVGDGPIVWKMNAESALKSEACTVCVETLKETYPVTYDEEKLNEIP